MPAAPLDGKVYGGAGDSWHQLEGVEKRAVIMINETLQFTENNGAITITKQDFDRLDEFVVDYDGAEVVFDKGSPAKTKFSIGNNSVLYKFVFDEIAHTVMVTQVKLIQREYFNHFIHLHGYFSYTVAGNFVEEICDLYFHLYNTNPDELTIDDIIQGLSNSPAQCTGWATGRFVIGDVMLITSTATDSITVSAFDMQTSAKTDTQWHKDQLAIETQSVTDVI
jgi:hypothetical protein